MAPNGTWNVFDSMEIVESKDMLDGWGADLGATAGIISGSISAVEQNPASYKIGLSKGLDFYANITYSWAIKVYEVDVK